MINVRNTSGSSAERNNAFGGKLPTYAFTLFLTITSAAALPGCGGSSRDPIDPVKMAQYQEDFARLELEREDLLARIRAAEETGSTGTLRSEIHIFNIQVNELNRHLGYSASSEVDETSVTISTIDVADYPEVFGGGG